MLPLCISGSHLALGIIDDDIGKSHRESIIVIRGVILLNANDNDLVVKVLPQHGLEVLTSIWLVLNFQIMLKHFKMYITITDIVGERRINVAYLIQGKEVAAISMFSDNVQYQIREPVKVLLIMKKERQLPEGVFMDRELNESIERKLITTPLDANDNIIKTDKLAHVMEMVLSLDELNNTDNLEDT